MMPCTKSEKTLASSSHHVRDGDLVFYLQVYRDYPLADACLKRLRSVYPSSRVIIMSDGDKSSHFRRFVSKYKAEYYEGERLYGVDKGGRMLHRMFAAFFKSPARFLVKIDTDTRVDRRFSYLPEGDFIFGNRQVQHGGNLQGGCVLIPLSICRKLYESRVFLSPELVHWRKSWYPLARTLSAKKHLKFRATQQKLIGFEWVLHWACLRLNILTSDFHEIYSEWKKTASNAGRRYAIVHPDKIMHKPAWLKALRTTAAFSRECLSLCMKTSAKVLKAPLHGRGKKNTLLQRSRS